MRQSAASFVTGIAILSCQCLCMSGSCGTALPQGVSIASDAAHGATVLSIRRAAVTTDLQFAGAMEAVDQVCQLPDGRLVVFGNTGAGSSNIQIVNVKDGKIDDSMGAYTPMLSPDERWITYRRFYPAQALNPSEEYLLYDLTKDARQNRPGFKAEDMDAPGVVVYPVVSGHKPFDSISLPPNQTHSFRSRRFYWADDSSAIVFADSVQLRLSLILVLVRSGAIASYTYPADNVACNDAAAATFSKGAVMLLNAQAVTSASEVREVRADFGLDACPPGNNTFQWFSASAPRRPNNSAAEAVG